MPVDMKSVINALENFVPDPEGDNAANLYELLKPLEAMPDRRLATPAIISLMERFPDADLGSPGPLVHELEAMGGYEELLLESLARRPVPLTIWMVNRQINGAKSSRSRARWVDALRSVSESKSASSAAKAEALSFLQYQELR